MLPKSLSERVAATLALATVIAAAIGAAAAHVLGSAPLGWLAAVLLSTPLIAWLGMRLTRSWSRVLEAVSSGIAGLRDRDFSVSITPQGGRELVTLVSAYNSLGEVLRRERFDIYQRELLLDTVLQTTPLALTLTNATGRIVYGNFAARQLLRGGRKLEGLSLATLIEGFPAALSEALGSGADTLFTVEIGGEPEVYHLSRRGFVLNGQPHELLLLKQLTRELAAQEVIVWKKVIRVIAHELNNSLAPIRSLAHSGTLLAARSESAELERVFATISERASHLAIFIEGYARFAKLPKPRPGPIAWPAFLARIAAVQPFRIEGPLPQRQASFDVGQLEQVMINLLKNAAESGSPPEAISVSVHTRAQGFVMEIADRGSGLSEQVLRDALLPFFSTKPAGTGLGLTLCREIVEAHGGHLTLANRPDGGAIVSIHLP
ncbi:MAG TPA: ATP-binding protein [Steroidobacteraceae bacterium]|nr:ATP-binding protein [Steroidobacteraceae bacterium]